MTDKEVGELWRRTQDHLTWPEPLLLEHNIVELIRKLVKDRTRLKEYITDRRCIGPCALAEALRDFSIDPATWPKEAA